jgi:hypothetical protein
MSVNKQGRDFEGQILHSYEPVREWRRRAVLHSRRFWSSCSYCRVILMMIFLASSSLRASWSSSSEETMVEFWCCCSCWRRVCFHDEDEAVVLGGIFLLRQQQQVDEAVAACRGRRVHQATTVIVAGVILVLLIVFLYFFRAATRMTAKVVDADLLAASDHHHRYCGFPYQNRNNILRPGRQRHFRPRNLSAQRTTTVARFCYGDVDRDVGINLPGREESEQRRSCALAAAVLSLYDRRPQQPRIFARSAVRPPVATSHRTIARRDRPRTGHRRRPKFGRTGV